MSSSQPRAINDDNKPEAIKTVPHALHSKTLPATATQDPEALTSIELTAASDPTTQQKRDDPYLVCFDEGYDEEK